MHRRLAPVLGAFLLHRRQILIEHDAVFAGQRDKALAPRAADQGQVGLARQFDAQAVKPEREIKIGMPMRTVLITISEVSRPVCRKSCRSAKLSP